MALDYTFPRSLTLSRTQISKSTAGQTKHFFTRRHTVALYFKWPGSLTLSRKCHQHQVLAGQSLTHPHKSRNYTVGVREDNPIKEAHHVASEDEHVKKCVKWQFATIIWPFRKIKSGVCVQNHSDPWFVLLTWEKFAMENHVHLKRNFSRIRLSL